MNEFVLNTGRLASSRFRAEVKKTWSAQLRSLQFQLCNSELETMRISLLLKNCQFIEETSDCLTSEELGVSQLTVRISIPATKIAEVLRGKNHYKKAGGVKSSLNSPKPLNFSLSESMWPYLASNVIRLGEVKTFWISAHSCIGNIPLLIGKQHATNCWNCFASFWQNARWCFAYEVILSHNITCISLPFGPHKCHINRSYHSCL